MALPASNVILPEAYKVELFPLYADSEALLFFSRADAKRCAEEQAQAAFDSGEEWQEWPVIPLYRKP